MPLFILCSWQGSTFSCVPAQDLVIGLVDSSEESRCLATGSVAHVRGPTTAAHAPGRPNIVEFEASPVWPCPQLLTIAHSNRAEKRLSDIYDSAPGVQHKFQCSYLWDMVNQCSYLWDMVNLMERVSSAYRLDAASSLAGICMPQDTEQKHATQTHH